MAKIQGTHRFDKAIKDRLEALAKKEYRTPSNMLEMVVKAGLKVYEGECPTRGK